MSEGKGHNSNQQLKSYVERISKIEEEIKELKDDVRDLCKEAKANGFDVGAIKAVVRELLEDEEKKEKRETREAIVEGYRASLGMLADLPLGQAAIERAAQ